MFLLRALGLPRGASSRGRRLGLECLEQRRVFSATQIVSPGRDFGVTPAAFADQLPATWAEAVTTGGDGGTDHSRLVPAVAGAWLSEAESFAGAWALQPAAPVITRVARVGQTLTVTLSVAGASTSNPLRVDFTAESTDGSTRYSVGSQTLKTASSTQVSVTIPSGALVNPVNTRALTATTTSTGGSVSAKSSFAGSAIQFETVTLHDVVWRSGQRNYDSVILVIYDNVAENGVRLESTASLNVTNSVLRLKDPLVMSGGSLTITNSKIEDRANPSTGHSISTSGAATVTMRDVTVAADPWKKWKFRGTSVVTLDRVGMSDPRPWLVFTESARVTSTSTPFHGSVGLNARATISGSTNTLVELILDGGNAVVDEDLPESVGSTPYVFPGVNETGVGVYLSIANSVMVGGKWGLTMDCRDNVTLRNSKVTANLTLFDRGALNTPLVGSVSGLVNRVYGATANETIVISGVSTAVTPKLTLRNVKVENWYPYAGPGNTLTVRNSVLADSAHSWGNNGQVATNVIDTCTTSYVRANNYVRSTVTDSTVNGKVEAFGNGQITLTRAYVTGDVSANQNALITVGSGTTILGRLLTSGNGRIVTTGSLLAREVTASGDSQVTLDGVTREGAAWDGAVAVRDAAVVRIKGGHAARVEGAMLGTFDGYAVYVSAEYAGFFPVTMLADLPLDTAGAPLLRAGTPRREWWG